MMRTSMMTLVGFVCWLSVVTGAAVTTEIPVTCDSTGAGCVTSCQGMADGDYQSCRGCNVYVTCSNGLTYDQRPCPSNLVWDDTVKRCEYVSTTCNGCTGDVGCVGTGAACITSCQGMADGDYQSCQGCNVYVTCSNGLTYDQRPCPSNLVWDDTVKRCEYQSATCNGCTDDVPCVGTGATCVTSCQGMADGDYQSCQGCHVYLTCSNGLTYDQRPCPSNLVWDDTVKRCEYVSTTCSACATTAQQSAGGDPEEPETAAIESETAPKTSAQAGHVTKAKAKGRKRGRRQTNFMTRQ